jgi:hypothetical protein
VSCRASSPDGTGNTGLASLRLIRGETLPLPGMLALFPATSLPNVTICHATVPEALDGADYVGPTWTLARQGFLLNIARIAIDTKHFSQAFEVVGGG